MFTSNLIKLRKISGLSQIGTARELGVARATYINLERGKTSPSLRQVERLAEIFQVSPAALIENLPSKSENHIGKIKKINLEAQEAIKPREIMQEKVETLREVLLYVLNKIGAKPNVGETVLYKLLYFIDFDYYEKNGRSITGLTYIRNHYGPTPAATFGGLVSAMRDSEELDIVETKFFNHQQRKYLPIIKPQLSKLSADELQHINEELDRLSDKTASELSALSHKDMPWLATTEGQQIDYQLAMYRTAETSVKEPEDEL